MGKAVIENDEKLLQKLISRQQDTIYICHGETITFAELQIQNQI